MCGDADSASTLVRAVVAPAHRRTMRIRLSSCATALYVRKRWAHSLQIVSVLATASSSWGLMCRDAPFCPTFGNVQDSAQVLTLTANTLANSISRDIIKTYFPFHVDRNANSSTIDSLDQGVNRHHSMPHHRQNAAYSIHDVTLSKLSNAHPRLELISRTASLTKQRSAPHHAPCGCLMGSQLCLQRHRQDRHRQAEREMIWTETI